MCLYVPVCGWYVWDAVWYLCLWRPGVSLCSFLRGRRVDADAAVSDPNWNAQQLSMRQLGRRRAKIPSRLSSRQQAKAKAKAQKEARSPKPEANPASR